MARRNGFDTATGGVSEGIHPKRQACSALNQGIYQVGQVGLEPTTDGL